MNDFRDALADIKRQMGGAGASEKSGAKFDAKRGAKFGGEAKFDVAKESIAARQKRLQGEFGAIIGTEFIAQSNAKFKGADLKPNLYPNLQNSGEISGRNLSEISGEKTAQISGEISDKNEKISGGNLDGISDEISAQKDEISSQNRAEISAKKQDEISMQNRDEISMQNRDKISTQNEISRDDAATQTAPKSPHQGDA